MTNSPEQPRSSTSLISQNKLLIEVRMTLEKRWKEFDAATMQEARNDPKAIIGLLFGNVSDEEIRQARDNHEEFQKAKKTFDEAKEALAGVKNDTELKILLKGPGKLSSTIAALESYFAKLKAPEKAKEHNKVLAHTLADLTSLKAQVTNIAEDKRVAEVARGNTSSLAPVTTETGEDILAPLEQATPAVATTIAGIGAAVVGTGLISEKSWKSTLAEGFKRFNDWFGGLFGEDTMFGKLFGGMKDRIAGLFKKLGEHFPIEGAVAATVGESKGIVGESVYTTTVAIIRKFFLPSDAGNAGEIYSYEVFAHKKFSDIESIYKNRKTISLKESFNLPKDTKITEKDLEIAIECLVGNKSRKSKLFVSQCKRSVGENFQDLTMQDIFKKLANPLSYFKALQKIDIGDNPQSIFDDFGFDISENGDATGELASKADNISPSVRKVLFISPFAANRYTTSKDAMISLSQTSDGLTLGNNPEIKKEYERIFQFGEAFRARVLESPNIHLGYREKFSDVFDKKGFSFRGLASLYCMLDGKTDFDNMTAIEKLAFYGACGTLASEMDSTAKGGFVTAYLKKLGSTETKEIPQDVKEIGGEFLIGIPKKAGNAIWESLKFIGGAASEAPELALGATALWYFGGQFRRAKHKFTYH